MAGAAAGADGATSSPRKRAASASFPCQTMRSGSYTMSPMTWRALERETKDAATVLALERGHERRRLTRRTCGTLARPRFVTRPMRDGSGRSNALSAWRLPSQTWRSAL